MFNTLSIKYKLFAVYAALSLIMVSLGFSLIYFQTEQSLELRIKEELGKSNQIITDMVETAAIVSIKNNLRAIAENNLEILEHLYHDYQQGLLTQAQAIDQATRILLSQSVGETGYIYCVNSQGVAVVHPRKGVLGNNFSSHQFVQTQISKKEGYLEYDWINPGDVNASRKALYMTYFEPWDWIISVSSYTSEFSTLISADDFKDRILGLTFGETGYSYIFNTSGTMVIHPELEGNTFNQHDGDAAAIIETMVRQKKGFLSYVWKNPSETVGREKFIAFDFIPNLNWIVASSSYVQEVFSPLVKMQKSFLVILILTFLVTGLVTLAVSTTITKPLTQLVHTFEHGANGDWSFRMENYGDDEIGKLSAGFNMFMDKLAVYQRALLDENTARKSSENKLQTLQSYLSNIINSMPSMLIGVDGDINVTQWNRTSEKLTGVSMTDAYGRPLSDVFPQIRLQMRQVRQSLELAEIQQWVRLPYVIGDGITHFEDITIYPLMDTGCQGAVIRIDDVTDKVRMEEVLIQNEKMLSVGRLAAGMAHEINNPLAGITQNAAVLVNRLIDKQMPANIKAAGDAGTTMDSIHQYMSIRGIPRLVEAITQSSSRMTSIVNNMLSFARKSDFSVSSHDLASLMDKSLELAATDYNLKKNYDFKSIAIEKQYAPDLPMVVCDGSTIQQVIMNILNNGAHAMFDEQTVNRHRFHNQKPTFVLRLQREKNSTMIRMEIQDNGSGMDEMTRKRILEPFFTTKPVGAGTGLGLSIASFIISETHGGTLDIVSEKDNGTTFIICLPLKRDMI